MTAKQEMKKKKRLTITLSPDLLKKIDATIDHRSIRSRSHAIESLIMQGLSSPVTTAVILTGGNRQRTLRALRKIHDRYLLAIMIDQLKEHGVTQIIICGGKDNNMIKKIFGDGSSRGVAMNYVKEDKPLGTAGALKKAEPYLTGAPFIVIHGDVLTNLNLTEFIDFHNNEQTLATIGVKPRLGEKRYGKVFLQGNKIIEFLASSIKVGISIVNTGLYIFDHQVLGLIPENQFSNLENDIFPLLIKQEELSAFLFQGIWYDISEEKDYEEAQTRW